MNVDIVQKNRDLRRYGEKSSFDAFFWAAFALLLAAVTYIYYWEAVSDFSDIHLHAAIASGFDFLDLHSITSRIVYPFWHVNYAVLYKLGVPFVWAAAIVCVAYKTLVFVLVQRILYLYLAPEFSAKLATLGALAAMFVTAVRIPSVNPTVYIGIGSPNVWHNPTQIVAILSSLLCVFYTAHCVYHYQSNRGAAGAAGMLPWKKTAMLSALLLFSVVCKPTFMQAFLPACGVYFLILWIKNPKHTRFFLQIILAFLPTVVYFLMQYLYYTGVVVPFTSGIAVSLDPARLWIAIRNLLMMAAFPLLTLLLTTKKGALREPVLALVLLITAAAVLEAYLFYETGMRENNGNFNWASMNAAFLLWVIALPRFFRAVQEFRFDQARLQEDAKKGVLPSATLSRAQTRLRAQSAGFLAAMFLLLWHLYSGMYYLYYLFSTVNVF